MVSKNLCIIVVIACFVCVLGLFWYVESQDDYVIRKLQANNQELRDKLLSNSKIDIISLDDAIGAEHVSRLVDLQIEILLEERIDEMLETGYCPVCNERRYW